MNLKSALAGIDQAGILLIFPINNAKEPASVWSHFFPRSKMKWEWDDSVDTRVHDLWFLREKLASSHKIAYAKWFRGRATAISLKVLPALLRILNHEKSPMETMSALSSEARKVLEVLNDNSPLSTKQLKEMTGLQGKFLEADYQRRLKELWQRLLILGVGEVDDGAFPSLAIGATQLYFEDEVKAAYEMSQEEAIRQLRNSLGADSLFFKYAVKLSSQLAIR